MYYFNLNRNYFFKIILLIFLTNFFLLDLHAQQQRTCGTMEYMEKKLGDSKFNRPVVPTPQGQSRSALPIITIPTVVHIIHNGATQNISEAQILSQIQALNNDFRRRNLDAANTPDQFLDIAADIEIEFCLASVDPNGFETTGITRTPTSTNFFGFNDEIKSNATGGQDPWNTADYLNIWVGSLGGGLLGYAQFPGLNPLTDGIVIDYQAFGTTGTATAPFDLGRTATHEVGHWLNLRHIWGDGGCSVDDGVADTPLAGAPNFSSLPCTHPGTNSCIEASGDLPDMFQNFMDLSDDACMNLFTLGQKDRMRRLFEPAGDRVSLLSSQGCANNGALATCTDNFINGEETGVDCGGTTCLDCSAFCNDGVLNGEETGIDCGGSCNACPPDPSQTCEVAIDIPSSGVYTALGPSIGMGANNNPATHANWYQFVAPANGTIDVMSCGEGVDTRLWIYEGCCENLTTVGDADDECELSPGGNSFATQLVGLAVTKGKRYFIEWDDRWSTNGFDFTFTFTPISRCLDGIKNGDETAIDCGGLSCAPCQASIVLDNVSCNNNETPADPSDDYITFDLNPIGIMGTNYTVTGISLIPSGGIYGAPTSFQTANGSIGLGDITLIISDNTNCSSSVILEDLDSCSPCQATIALDNVNVSCNDNETPVDPSDDYITFDLNLIGITGTNYTVTGGSVMPSGGIYGTPTSFQTANGSAGLGDITLIISDNTNCSSSVIISDPGNCSTSVIPTLSQWGLLIYSLLILNMSLFLISILTRISRID